jgi:hypothetical protein
MRVKEYLIDAGSGSRIRPAAAGPILLLFWRTRILNSLYLFFHFQKGS